MSYSLVLLLRLPYVSEGTRLIESFQLHCKIRAGADNIVAGLKVFTAFALKIVPFGMWFCGNWQLTGSLEEHSVLAFRLEAWASTVKKEIRSSFKTL